MAFPELDAASAYADLACFRIIDVREEHEFHGPLGTIEGAELVPLATVEANAGKLAGDLPLLLVCRSGKRSGVACATLQECGVEDVTNLAGGMIGWNRAGLPIVRSEPKNLAQLRDQILLWLVQVSPLTDAAAREVARERFARLQVGYEDPSHAAIEDLIDFVAETLETSDPPDLELSLAFYRSSLAAI